VARTAARHGLPTYLYLYSYLPPSQRGHAAGPVHGDEVYAVFSTMDLIEHNLNADTQRVIDEMQSRWVQFAKTGHPADPAQWPAFKPGAERLLDFTNSGPVIRTDYARERLDLAEILAVPPTVR
jgi:para-nitrobenzyl esterase